MNTEPPCTYYTPDDGGEQPTACPSGERGTQTHICLAEARLKIRIDLGEVDERLMLRCRLFGHVLQAVVEVHGKAPADTNRIVHVGVDGVPAHIRCVFALADAHREWIHGLDGCLLESDNLRHPLAHCFL